MVFSSPTFLFLFLPAVLAATWLAPAGLRRFILLGASMVFYAWGVQEFLLLILASTLVDWAVALGISRQLKAGNRRAAGLLLTFSVVQNLGLLGYFKYAGFVSEQLTRLAAQLGMSGPGTLEVLLPIGISFFTFEKISYVVDVWRGDVKAQRDPLDVVLFVSFFPRSIAGPIVRLREIQHELRRPQPTAEMMSAGAMRFSYGLGKKVLIADQIAPIADAAFAAAPDGTLSMGAAWLGALAYMLQLYFDFSAYSDMAIGIGLMLGFRLPENFRRPYSSVSMTDFWRRWHMTLSRWFRDYVYIPLGGNRKGGWHTYRNLLIVFGLTGLWHGAAWAFVLWGLYHGGWLMLERRMGWRAVDDGEAVRWYWARRASVVLIVLIGWVLFRAESLGLAIDYYRAMVTPGSGGLDVLREALTTQTVLTLIAASAIFVLPGKRCGGVTVADGGTPLAQGVRVATLIALPLLLAYSMASSYSPFLYFQF